MHLCLGTTPAMQRTMTFNRLALDDVNRAVDLRVGASGKSLNVARVLTVLGEKATATGFLGGDIGRFMRADLAAAGIEHDFVEAAAPTRVCVTLIDRSTQSVTELVEEAGRVTPEEMAALMARFRSMLPGKKMLVLSGSLAPGVSESIYADCCQAANEAGVSAIVDARGAALRLALCKRPLLVKPNRVELADTIGIATDTDAGLRKAIAALLDAGAQSAVVTVGSQGAVACDGKSLWRIAPLKMDVVSPIGSGDAFAAGIAAAFARGQAIPHACRLATACAAANAMVEGSGIVHLDDVKRLEKQVEIISMGELPRAC